MKPSKSLPSLLAAVLAPLLIACPSGPEPGQAEDGSTGMTGIDLTSGPSSGVMTTTSDGTTTGTPETTTVGSSSSDSGPLDTSSSGEPPPECVMDDDCSDGDDCNGLEGCMDGSCVQISTDCNDGVDCTVDSCDETGIACLHQPDDSVCGCGETCDAMLGCGNHCVPTECNGQIYECGDCIDNDANCDVDNYDSDCWGPCDNNESGWAGEVPGQQNQSECNVMDCYFDANSGSGNDDCYWSHSCDPLEPTDCTYDPNTNLPGTPSGCTELQMMQSMDCLDICGPVVPNGCDCFGCCDVTAEDGTQVTVYLGTRDPITDVGTCNLEVATDPVLCHPCTQVQACINTCETCELCIGQVELPPECGEGGQECPPGLQQCGQPGQDPCPMGQACITGCCVPNPQ